MRYIYFYIASFGPETEILKKCFSFPNVFTLLLPWLFGCNMFHLFLILSGEFSFPIFLSYDVRHCVTHSVPGLA